MGRNIHPVTSKKHKEGVSIRDGFEEYDDDEEEDESNSKRVSPGPGHYATHDSSFRNKHSHARFSSLPGNG